MKTREFIWKSIDYLLKSNAVITLLVFFARKSKTLHKSSIRALCGYTYRLSLNGDFLRAKDITDRVLALTNDSKVLNFLSPIYRLQGNFKKSIEVATKAEQLRYDFAKISQLDQLNLRIFSRSFTPVGHTGIIDIFIKAQLLGIISQRNNVIVGKLESFANPALVQYWDSYCSIINSPETVNQLTQFSYPIEELLSLIQLNDGRLVQLEQFAMEVQMRWESEKRSHLLHLRDQHKEKGYQILHKLGMPKGAWFCGLHVREGGDALRSIRNADISTYDAAIEEISRLGGWVIRMGDKSMHKLQSSNPCLIDYVHSEHQSDWMDIFIWSEGKFFLGTGSGPSAVPLCFGKPVAYSNWGPLGHRQWGKDDIYLPKLYIHESSGIPLTMEERMSDKYAYHESHIALKDSGIAVIDNSPEEIRDLILEMLAKIGLNQTLSAEQKRQKKRFAECSIAHKIYPSDLANAFIDRYPNF